MTRLHTGRTRSIVKAITFRTFSILSDLVVVYAVTRRIGYAVTLTAVTNVPRTVLYFVHERAWDRVTWGREEELVGKSRDHAKLRFLLGPAVRFSHAVGSGTRRLVRYGRRHTDKYPAYQNEA